MRALYSFLITAFFGAMMFLLLRDHVIPTWKRGGGIDVDRSVLADNWTNSDEWLALSIDNTPIGAIRTLAEYDADTNQYLAKSQIEIRTPFLNGRLLSSALMNRRLELTSALVRLHLPARGQKFLSAEQLDEAELPAGVFEAACLVEGNLMRFRIRRDDAVLHESVRIARPVTLSDSLTPVLKGQMLTKGVTYATDIYDPLLGTDAGKVELEYLADRRTKDGDDVNFLKMVEVRYQALKTTIYVDRAGTVVRREIPLLQGVAAGTLPASSGGFVLISERREATELSKSYPELAFVGRDPALEAKDFAGENKGELFRGTSILSLIGGGLKGGLPGLAK